MSASRMEGETASLLRMARAPLKNRLVIRGGGGDETVQFRWAGSGHAIGRRFIGKRPLRVVAHAVGGVMVLDVVGEHPPQHGAGKGPGADEGGIGAFFRDGGEAEGFVLVPSRGVAVGGQPHGLRAVHHVGLEVVVRVVVEARVGGGEGEAGRLVEADEARQGVGGEVGLAGWVASLLQVIRGIERTGMMSMKRWWLLLLLLLPHHSKIQIKCQNV